MKKVTYIYYVLGAVFVLAIMTFYFLFSTNPLKKLDPEYSPQTYLLMLAAPYINGTSGIHENAQAYAKYLNKDPKVESYYEYWIKRAANTGDNKSICAVGEYYYNKKNYKEASIWLNKSAEKKYPDSFYFLGAICFMDKSQFNEEKGMEFMNKAAELGSEKGKSFLKRIIFVDYETILNPEEQNIK